MLRFLSSLFSGDSADNQIVSEDIVNKAIERAVDGTDTRIRFYRKYREQLRTPVTQAIAHVIQLVDSLPEPAELARGSFRTDPRIRAFFVSPDHLEETLGEIQTIPEYLAGKSGVLPAEIFGLLTMEQTERRTFGMQLDGDHVRRDVPQVAVSFSGHNYLAPSDSEAQTRLELKKRAFDFLVEVALERIASSRSQKADIRKQQALLAKKLDAMKAGHWGIEAMVKDAGNASTDIPALEEEIARLNSALEGMGRDTGDMQHSLDILTDTLGRSRDWLDLRTVTLHLDQMGNKLDEEVASPSNTLELTELFSATGERRIALLARFPRNQLPDKPDFFEQASSYLT